MAQYKVHTDAGLWEGDALSTTEAIRQAREWETSQKPPAGFQGQGGVEYVTPQEPERAQAYYKKTRSEAKRLAATGTAIAGTLAGGAALPGILGPILGAPLGAAAGGAVGQMIEGEKPTWEHAAKEAAWTAAFPGAAFTVGRPLGKLAGRLLPGSNVARHQTAVRMMDELANLIKVRPTKMVGADLERFLKATGKYGPSRVPMKATAEQAQAVADDLAPLQGFFRSIGEEKAATTLADILEGRTGQVPIDELQKFLQRIGQLAQTAPARKGAVQAVGRLQKGMLEDLRLAAEAGDPQARKLVGLRQEYRKATTRDIVGKTARTRGVTTPTETAEYEVVKPGAVKQQFTRGAGLGGEDLVKRVQELPPQEQAGLFQELDRISRIDRPGGNEGLARFLNPIPWGVGAGVGLATIGGYPGAVIGGGTFVAGKEALRKLVMTRPGQKLVLRLLENRAGAGPYSRLLGAGLGQYIEEP